MAENWIQSPVLSFKILNICITSIKSAFLPIKVRKTTQTAEQFKFQSHSITAFSGLMSIFLIPILSYTKGYGFITYRRYVPMSASILRITGIHCVAIREYTNTLFIRRVIKRSSFHYWYLFGKKNTGKEEKTKV